jgi:hypothetical protein
VLRQSAQSQAPTHLVACRYKESFTSTGGMSRSFTSTYAAIDTKATRQLVRLERNPSKKVCVRYTCLYMAYLRHCTQQRSDCCYGSMYPGCVTLLGQGRLLLHPTNIWLGHWLLQGYVRLHTTLGDLNLELYCDITPRT